MDFAEFVDEEMEPDPELNRITNAVIGAAIEVHRVLGPGFLESVYQKALEREFELRGIQFVPQQRIAVDYKGTEVGEGWLDFLIEQKVVVEIKAVDTLAPIHKAQVISYLRTTHHRLALLINFNVKLLKDGIKRIAL
ncbi:MAG TPA: GxxExxY protein [Tepidisphaeraceae bacterium]|jgi:GxxExxY protein|nr:GxxExxY protein [Tepidisphaeraceae bacterium]